MRARSASPVLPRIFLLWAQRAFRLLFFHPAANRDEDVFRNPDQFDISRPDVGEQVAYGAGIHRW